jgi:hypothetical protein
MIWLNYEMKSNTHSIHLVFQVWNFKLVGDVQNVETGMLNKKNLRITNKNILFFCLGAENTFLNFFVMKITTVASFHHFVSRVLGLAFKANLNLNLAKVNHLLTFIFFFIQACILFHHQNLMDSLKIICNNSILRCFIRS